MFFFFQFEVQDAIMKSYPATEYQQLRFEHVQRMIVEHLVHDSPLLRVPLELFSSYFCFSSFLKQLWRRTHLCVDGFPHQIFIIYQLCMCLALGCICWRYSQTRNGHCTSGTHKYEIDHGFWMLGFQGYNRHWAQGPSSLVSLPCSGI